MNLQKFFTIIGIRRDVEAGARGVPVPAERREHRRHVVEFPLDYNLLDGIDRSGVVADASEGGLQVRLNEPVEIGSLLNIDLFFLRDSELMTIRVMARVVWSDASGRKLGGEYRHGLAFQAFKKEGLNKFLSILQQKTNMTTA